MAADGGGGLLDPGGAMERLAAWKGRIDKLATDTKAMSERLQQLRVTATDANGMAEVTLDSSGVLVGLRLGRQIQRVSPEVVAATIMATIQQARAQLADRSQEIITSTLGEDSAAARDLAARVGEQLRGAEPGDGDRAVRW
jgi:DNA-binding protein YbaB